MEIDPGWMSREGLRILQMSNTQIDLTRNLVFSGESTDVTAIPKDKAIGYRGYKPAVHTGVVDIKCVINRTCPFTKTQKVNDTFVFNSQSIRGWDRDYAAFVDAAPGSEGIYLHPYYYLRHNYIAGKERDSNKLDLLPMNKADVAQASSKVYRREQRWIISTGFFDTDYLLPRQYVENADSVFAEQEENLSEEQIQLVQARFGQSLCKQLPRWSYHTIRNDDTRNPDTTDSYILIPTMISGAACSGHGVHWKVEKQTPLYQGEDFFVLFKKYCKVADVPVSVRSQITGEAQGQSAAQSASQEAETPMSAAVAATTAAHEAQDKFAYRFKHPDYFGLDVTWNATADIKIESTGQTASIPMNAGVVSYNDKMEPTDTDSYDFRFKPYLVLEMGVLHDKHNYCLLIVNGAPVRLVRLCNPTSFDNRGRIQSSKVGRASVVVGTMDNIGLRSMVQGEGTSPLSGTQLLAAEWFKVHVRNHLGQLGFQFVTPNHVSDWWFVSREDSIINSNNGKVTKQSEIMMVCPAENPPQGQKNGSQNARTVQTKKGTKIAIWGGNIRAGFVFGPMQYVGAQQQLKNEKGVFTFPFPVPGKKDQTYGTGLAVETTTNAPPNQPSTYSDALGPLSDEEVRERAKLSVSLPIPSQHKILLSVSDDEILVVPNDKTNKLYIQDAQLFRYWDNGNLITEKGSFYKKPPLKELGSTLSYIGVSKIPLGRGGGALIDSSSHAEIFRIAVSLEPGSHTFGTKTYTDYNDGDGSLVWYLPSCKTPVLTMVRLVSEPLDDYRWETRGVDVSEHVMEFSDSWSAQDFTRIDHTGSIKFYMNPGASYSNDQTEFLLSLANKAFYIEVWAGYRDISSDNVSLWETGYRGCNYSKLPGYYKLFTGICYGGSLSQEPGKRIMDCQVFDYSKILEHMLFFNGPFFDGVRDVNAIHEIVKTAGLRDTNSEDPGVLLARFKKEAKDQHMYFASGPDGRPVVLQVQALPNAYNKFSNAFFKPKDGDKLLDMIYNIAKKVGKVFFFDAYGIAHYESYFDYSVMGSMTGIDRESLTGEKAPCVQVNGTAPDGSSTTTYTTERSFVTFDPVQMALWWYTTNPNRFRGQLAINAVNAQRAVSDVYNHIRLMTTTPNGELIIGDDLDWNTFDKPDTEGFLGYLKMMYQQDGIFGSMEAAKNIVAFYKAMRNPPLVIAFESLGLPVRSLDMLLFDGQPARVMKVDTTVNVNNNLWTNKFECEWLYPVQFNPTQEACEPTPQQ